MRLSPPVTVDISEFLDHARQQQLQHALATLTVEQTAQVERLAQLPAADLTTAERALRELLHQRQHVAGQELPYLVQQTGDSGGTGAVMGRMIGEIGDMLLPSLLTKWLGKATQIGTVASRSRERLPGGTIMSPPFDYLAQLEKLSLGYLGEQIGARLDGAPREEYIVDPAAQSAQQAALAQLDGQVREVRAQLARQDDLARQHELTGWALEQNRKEQAQLQSRLADMERRATERQQAFVRAAQAERQLALRRQVKQALAQWHRSFAQQAGDMAELLRVRLRDEREAQVAAVLSERLADVEALRTRLEAAPAERAAALAQLQAEAAGLQAALALLA